MSMSLDEVLRHPSLARAEPTLLTGRAHTDRVVRWVHSSEVLDIAPLLRGGELLLTGGVVLAGAGRERQRAYIRDLTAHGVSAVAVETATAGAGLPDALVDEARRQGFVLVQLARTVPFVEITESINGLLINDSVRRLRLADSISDALSTRLTSGADLQQLADTLVNTTGAGVTIRDRTGEPLASATASASEPRAEPETRQAPITVNGVTSAALELLPSADSEPTVLDAALDRAPQAFGLALLRTQPPTPTARAAQALFHALRQPTRARDELASLLEASGLESGSSFVAVIATYADPGFQGALEQALRHSGRQVLSHVDDHEFLALVALAPDRPDPSRQALVDRVCQVSDLVDDHPKIGIGPIVTGGEQLDLTVTEARRCLDTDLEHTAVNGVVDAAGCSLHRLVHRLDSDDTLHQFVHEQLGALLQQPPDTRDRLLHTLEVFFDCAANKTETAQHLHLRRQTLYQRLDRLSHHLGREVTDPASLGELQVAVRLLRVLDKRPAGRIENPRPVRNAAVPASVDKAIGTTQETRCT